MIRFGHHRRFTANHTFHVDLGRRRLFLKLNPNRAEAEGEIHGYQQIVGYYPTPKIYRRSRLGRWTLLAYQRVGTGRPDEGLLLDEITRADLTGDASRLDACLDGVLAQYRSTIIATLRRSPLSGTVQKLYGERARAGGRLDRYYGSDEPLLVVDESTPVRPSDLRRTLLLVNGDPYRMDCAALVAWLRERFDPSRLEAAAITQGDPTDFNIGWNPAEGPVWFDYDTGGLNAVAGEFANFLWYQFLLGCWLVPIYNPHAFADHAAGVATQQLNRPTVSLERIHDRLVIDYQHRLSPARRRAIARYLTELVQPIATRLGVTDLVDWLRPWLAMRILAVHRICDMRPADAALSLALLAQVLHPDTTIDSLFGMAAETLPRALERQP